MISHAPFRTPPLSGADVGWWRPIGAAVLGLVVPSIVAWIVVYLNGAPLSGPPKDDSAYTLSDHATFISAFVAASIVVTWMLIPVAVLVVRAAAMLGWAGWGVAVLLSWVSGLPAVHVMLNGDLTTDGNGLWPHVMIAIAILALSVWVAFWGLMERSVKIHGKPK